MKPEKKVILQAEFNPRIKSYIFLYGFLLLFVTLIGIPVIPFWFLGLGQYISRRYYENLICKLTEQHLEFKKGVMFKVEKTIPLENIQDLTFIDNPILKIFDLRVLKIETAGQSNPQGSDMKLVGIIGAQDFKEEILDQRDQIKYEKRKEIASPGKDTDQEILQTLKEIRDILKGR